MKWTFIPVRLPIILNRDYNIQYREADCDINSLRRSMFERDNQNTHGMSA